MSSTMNQTENIKTLIIAGAGPGDPELVTLKTARHLREAEVVITDRLVSEDILEAHVHRSALLLHAGKQRGREGSTPQHIINELLVDYALQGKKVVRLKGGDVSVFSNLLDELQALNRHGIPYEIVPGITAACGAAAYAGIPLTARDHANAIRFLTLHRSGLLEPEYWKELAATNDTLVFYMSGDTSAELIANLIQQDIKKDRHIAVIEQATTPMQTVSCCPLYEYGSRFGNRSYMSPAIIIVGRVAGLHEQFRWKPDALFREPYFKTLKKDRQQEERA
jgi:uroporphyrin-III C-methyltransferase/precorrin-2 dehydrogenase/sirohydrochlorin ferrochelatase/uroporphyrin-III C-methyltransferase